MAWRPPDAPLAWDIVAGTGLVVFFAATALPWYTYQPCPIFQDCGEIVTANGWSDAPIWFAFAGVLAVLGFWLVPHGVGRRAALAGGGVLALLPLSGIHFGMDMRIFANVEGPFPAFWLASMAASVWLAAALVSAWMHVPKVQSPMPELS